MTGPPADPSRRGRGEWGCVPEPRTSRSGRMLRKTGCGCSNHLPLQKPHSEPLQRSVHVAIENTSGRGQQGCGVFIRESEATLQSCGVGVPAALTTFLWGDQLGTQATGNLSLQVGPPHQCGAHMDCFRPVCAWHSHRAAERAPRTPAQPTFVNCRELSLLISEGDTFVCFLPLCCLHLGSTTVASSGDRGPLACKMGKGQVPWLDTVWGSPGDLAGGPSLPMKTQTTPLPGAAVRMLRLQSPTSSSRPWPACSQGGDRTSTCTRVCAHAHPRGCFRFTQLLLTLN